MNDDFFINTSKPAGIEYNHFRSRSTSANLLIQEQKELDSFSFKLPRKANLTIIPPVASNNTRRKKENSEIKQPGRISETNSVGAITRNGEVNNSIVKREVILDPLATERGGNASSSDNPEGQSNEPHKSSVSEDKENETVEKEDKTNDKEENQSEVSKSNKIRVKKKRRVKKHIKRKVKRKKEQKDPGEIDNESSDGNNHTSDKTSEESNVQHKEESQKHVNVSPLKSQDSDKDTSNNLKDISNESSNELQNSLTKTSSSLEEQIKESSSKSINNSSSNSENKSEDLSNGSQISTNSSSNESDSSFKENRTKELNKSFNSLINSSIDSLIKDFSSGSNNFIKESVFSDSMNKTENFDDDEINKVDESQKESDNNLNNNRETSDDNYNQIKSEPSILMSQPQYHQPMADYEDLPKMESEFEIPISKVDTFFNNEKEKVSNVLSKTKTINNTEFQNIQGRFSYQCKHVRSEIEVVQYDISRFESKVSEVNSESEGNSFVSYDTKQLSQEMAKLLLDLNEKIEVNTVLEHLKNIHIPILAFLYFLFINIFTFFMRFGFRKKADDFITYNKARIKVKAIQENIVRKRRIEEENTPDK